VGYSSIAQLGFITLGIFALNSQGAQGAVFQMLNHGLITGALFLIVAALALRAGGSELLSRMGGIAKNAPVLAGLFTISAFALLAMPGSANFVGELYILFGAFDEKFVYAVVASVGVVRASVYSIRLFQRTMHNNAGPDVRSFDASRAEIGLLVPFIAVTLALAVYPNFVLTRTEAATVSKLPAQAQEEVATR
jgi:NADH-quinone oxidoreductase subunit M